MFHLSSGKQLQCQSGVQIPFTTNRDDPKGIKFKSCQKRFRLDIGENVLMEEKWKCPCLWRDFKAMLVWHLGTRVNGDFGSAGEWLDSMTLEGFSNLNNSCGPIYFALEASLAIPCGLSSSSTPCTLQGSINELDRARRNMQTLGFSHTAPR